MAGQTVEYDDLESHNQGGPNVVENVLGPSGLHMYLKKNLSIDNDLASMLYGWKPQLLEDPPYHVINALNDGGKHQDAFKEWHKFAMNNYTEKRLLELCKCLKKVGKNAKPRLREVAMKIESEIERCGKSAKRSPAKTTNTTVTAKRRKTSYSSVTALDVVESIGKGELIKKFKPMLTDHRAVLLEDTKLINSDCRDSIQAKLKSGQRAGAATELVEYFENNHDGDKMMEFCTFLEDQAGEASPLLRNLAKTIREHVEKMSASGSTSQEHHGSVTIPPQKKPSKPKAQVRKPTSKKAPDKKPTSRKAPNKKPSSRTAPKRKGTS